MIGAFEYLVPVTRGQLARLDTLIELLMELRDILDGDLHLEDGDQDRCEAYDDAPVAGEAIGCGSISGTYPGSEADAEDEFASSLTNGSNAA